jgi:acyl-CoA reductase-like NAD-dependent aldehyde dehydrogenase
MSTDSDVSADAVVPFIDGASGGSHSRTTFEVVNPSNGRALLQIPAGCTADVDRAVKSSRHAFADRRWSDAPPSLKKKTLHQWATLIEGQAAALDAMDAAEMGKPVSVTLFNATAAADLARFYAESVDKAAGDVYESDAHSLVMQRRVPRGVVAAITPWNFPTFNAVLKAAPAVAAGNSLVLKPSELSSRSAVRLAQLAMQAGLPAGVLNVVPGLGETVGCALGLHMDVDMVTFTGSTDVGKLMLQYAGQSNLKVVSAECGGKSPQIVFADGVDLDAASESIARFLLINQGQICSVGSRLLVQRAIETAMVKRICAETERIVIGDPLDRKTTFGPLVSAKHCAKVLGYIDTAQAEGAVLMAGGRRALPESGGYFVEPTIFGSVSPSAQIAQEEVFGPVLSVIPFDDVDDAIRIANSTMYGLSAYVWTTNLSTGMRMAKGIRSSVTVNAMSPKGEGAGHAASWEPAGQSGLGVEGGIAGLDTYMRRQFVSFNHE